MNINKIKYLNTISNISVSSEITFDNYTNRILFLQSYDRIFQLNISNDRIDKISDELEIVSNMIFYTSNNKLLVISDGIYIFDISNKTIEKVLSFSFDEYYYINYCFEMNKIILVKAIKYLYNIKHKVETFDINSMKTMTFIEDIRYEVKNIYYSDNKLFFTLDSDSFQSTVEIYNVKNKDLLYNFEYSDNILEMIYLKKQEKILFLYSSVEPKPSFIKMLNLKSKIYEAIQNNEKEAIFNISNYNDEYFVYLSNNKITFCRKDFSSKKSYLIDKIANKCIFPLANNFKTFITYNRYGDENSFDIWELIK